MAATCSTMVFTDFCNNASSAGGSLPLSLKAKRSADSWMGVSGFLISWATRRATSAQALERWPETISEISSNTTSR